MAGKITTAAGLMMFVVLCACLQARTANAAIFVEQVNSKAPEVRAYVQGGVNQNSKFKGKITGTDRNGNTSSIDLVQDGETIAASGDDGVTNYIFLFDNSGSVSENHFKAVKGCLADFRKELGKRTQDKMSLYTVGVKSANQKREVVFEGASGGGASEDIKKIKAIKRDGKKTVLYRTINEITGRTKSSKERVVLVLLTDGEDDSAGSNNNPGTTLSNVKNASVPVYGVLLHYGLSGSGDQEKIRVTKEMLNTEGSNDRMVRGIDVSRRDSASAVESGFRSVVNSIRDKTFLVKLKAGSNRTLTNTRLTLTKTNGTVEEAKIKSFSYSDYVADKDAPKISEVLIEAENQISVKVSDENGLDVPSLVNQANYKVFRVVDGETTKESLAVIKAEIPSAEDGKTEKKVVLTLEREITDGDYVLKISGLKDASEDGNIIDHMDISFGMEKGVPSAGEDVPEDSSEKKGTESETAGNAEGKTAGSYWWISIPVLLVVIGILLFLLFKRKKTQTSFRESAFYGTEQADSCLITLTVTDGKGFTKDLQWDVEGSFFVGRSEICEVFFDDEMLSKQHFVIEVTKAGCFIEDLSSTNGTFVNGIQIKGRVELSEGDEILAGREHFLVRSFRKGFDSISNTAPM
ncbi:MAG: FHA domain-containing protein [Lachnospiraceae bacterium]|nr:FHA domain-containing protein [Lachnospiraceae bacterium]